jgi:hypothetical protein
VDNKRTHTELNQQIRCRLPLKVGGQCKQFHTAQASAILTAGDGRFFSPIDVVQRTPKRLWRIWRLSKNRWIDGDGNDHYGQIGDLVSKKPKLNV